MVTRKKSKLQRNLERATRDIKRGKPLRMTTVRAPLRGVEDVAKYKWVQKPMKVFIDPSVRKSPTFKALCTSLTAKQVKKPTPKMQRVMRDMLAASFEQAAHDAHGLNEHWYADPVTGVKMTPNDGLIAIKLLLIVSEIAEAFEALRKDANDDKLPKHKGLHVELIDAGIRLFDLIGFLNIKTGKITRDKTNYNLRRKDHKPAARAAKGGKRF